MQENPKMPIIQAKLYHKFWDLSHRVMYWCLNIVWSFKSVLTTVSEMLLSTDTDARVMTWQGILKMLRFFMRTPLRPKPTVFGPLQPQLPSLSTSRQAHLFIETDTDTSLQGSPWLKIFLCHHFRQMRKVCAKYKMFGPDLGLVFN